jgi:hypothetical protein
MNGRGMHGSASRTGSALLAGLLLAMTAVAQAPREGDKDYLEQVKRLNQIAAQKLESDVRTAVAEATKLSATNLEKAVGQLKKLLATVEADDKLTVAKREELKRLLNERIRIIQTNRPGDNKGPVIIGSRADEVRRNADQDDVNRTLSIISSLKKEGKVEDANRLALELARKYPNNPAARVAGQQAATAGRIGNENATRQDNANRYAGALKDISSSAVPPKGDVDYPKDWKQRTAKRTTGVKLTEKETAIIKALDSSFPQNEEFKDAKFEDVLKYISDFTNQPLIVDGQALKDAQVGYDSPVNLRIPKGISVRTILRKLLGEFGLTYVIREESIQIISQVKAREIMVTRTYYLGDLLEGGFGVNGLAALALPGLKQAQIAQTAAQIIEMIQNSVDPESWKDKGGPGTITFNFATRSLIIRQSAEVHAMLGSGLR